MVLISPRRFGKRPAMSIVSSRARSQLTCRCRPQPSTSWRSTSKRRRRWYQRATTLARPRRRGDRMRRREFITLAGGAVAAWPFAARAQQPERMRQVGLLLSGTADDVPFQTWVGAFLQGLAQSGWVVDRNVRIETRWAGSKADDIRRHAQELAALAPDVILAHG